MDLTAGALCLDFVNTGSRLAARGTQDLGVETGEGDRLRSYEDLVRFGELTGTVATETGERLREEAAADPESAGVVLGRARRLRESLYRVFAGLSEGVEPEASDLEVVQEAAAEAVARQQLVRTADGFALRWPADAAALGRALWPVAASALALLTGEELGRVKECAAEDCNWLFLDASRNRSRRWCDMKACGNRAKARHYYHRHQAG